MLTGLVLTVPDLDAFLAAHRHSTDRAGTTGVPAHVTALYPWLPEPHAAGAVERLAGAVAGSGPVTMTFRQVATFPVGVAYLVPEPDQPVRALIRRLVKAFPECPPYGGEHPDPAPHLTVTSCPPAELAEVATAVAADLVPVTCTVGVLTALEQAPDGRWRTAYTVRLGTAGG